MIRGMNDIARIVTIVVIAIALISTTASYVRKVNKGRSAILRWQPQVMELADGVNVYEKYTYPNPPLMGLCLWPIAAMPDMPAAMSLYAIKVVMSVMLIVWSLRIARGRAAPPGSLPWLAVGAVVLLCLRMIMSDLQHGNVNIVVAFVVMGGLYAYYHGKDAVAGLCIALATTFKATPALFIPYFIYKRQWKLTAWTAVGLALFLFLVPGLFLGQKHNAMLLKDWTNQMVMPFMSGEKTAYTMQINQSISGTVYRFLTDSPGVAFKVDDEDDVPEDEAFDQVNIASMSPGTVKWIVYGLYALVLGVGLWVARTPTGDRRDWRLACEYAMVFAAMLLISPRSWKHHYVIMALPYACIAAAAAVHVVSQKQQRALAGVLIFCFFSMLTTAGAVTGWVKEGEGHKYFLAYGMFVWTAVASYAALAWLLRRYRDAPPDTRDIEPAISNP